MADRFHLLMNARGALEEVMYRQNRLLRSLTLAALAATAPTEGSDAYAGCRLRLQPHLALAEGVAAAATYGWSNGQVEGQVHRLKLVRRQMYGRDKLDLLRARVLHAA